MKRIFLCFFKSPRRCRLVLFLFIWLFRFFSKYIRHFLFKLITILLLVFIWSLIINLLFILILAWTLWIGQMFTRRATWVTLTVSDSLVVRANLHLLKLLCLVILLIEPGCLNLLVDVLGSIIEASICDTQLMTHIIWLHHVWVFLAASETMLASAIATKSTSIVWFSVRSHLTLTWS